MRQLHPLAAARRPAIRQVPPLPSRRPVPRRIHLSGYPRRKLVRRMAAIQCGGSRATSKESGRTGRTHRTGDQGGRTCTSDCHGTDSHRGHRPAHRHAATTAQIAPVTQNHMIFAGQSSVTQTTPPRAEISVPVGHISAVVPPRGGSAPVTLWDSPMNAHPHPVASFKANHPVA